MGDATGWEESVFVYGIVAGVLITTGMIGNALIIAYFAFKEKRKSSYNLFILLLAISDFVGSFSFSAGWIELILDHWPFSGVLCKVLSPLDDVCLAISSFLMLGLAYERYHGITKPFSTLKIKRSHVYIYFCVISICSSLYYIPTFMETRLTDKDCFSDLQWDTEQLMAYMAVYQITKGIIPFILMAYIYFQIKKVLKHYEKSLRSTTTLRRNRTVLQTLKILLISFTICVGIASLMHMISFILEAYTGLLKDGSNTLLLTIYECFILLNNAVNCFVYAGYITNFRKFLKKLFCVRRLARELDEQHELRSVYYTNQSSLRQSSKYE